MSEIVKLSAKPSNLLVWFSKSWLLIFFVVFGLWVWTPFLAPVFMHLGWVTPAKAIYFIYSFFCHQLPERSYFLFGQKVSYSLSEIQSVWIDTINPLLLRKFIGTNAFGWKVAWSDRMISFYGGIWFFALAWDAFRQRVKSIPLWGFFLFLLPLAVDGSTHFLSDLAGIGNGFRDSNLWLSVLTKHSLSAGFYAEDVLGSFNSWMRIITGLLAAMGLVWFTFPFLNSTRIE